MFTLQLRTEFFQIALINLPHEWEGGIDQAKRDISTTRLSALLRLVPVAYQRGGLPRPFRENQSWERLGA